MNLKLITLSSLRAFFSNLNSKLTGFTTSGRRYKLSQDSNGNYYTNVPWRGVISGNSGISVKEENVLVNNEEIPNYSVSAVPRTKVGIPTCPGYTYNNGYFVADNPIGKGSWYTAMFREQNVTVTQNYNYGGSETREAIAHILSRKEIDRWWYSGNGHSYPFWTSTLRSYSTAICCYGGVNGGTYYIDTEDGDSNDNFEYLTDLNVYVYLGFKDPFSEELVDNTAGTITSLVNYVNYYSSCISDERYARKNQFSFDSNNKILYITGV